MNKNFKSKIVLLICLTIMTMVFLSHAFAYDSKYTNMLTSINFEKNNNGLKLNFYTIKPYYTKIDAIKKSSFEYVIILPETYNGIEGKPNISSVSDCLQDIKISLFSYLFSDSNNGYTKITLITSKLDLPISINNKVILADSKLSEKFNKITSDEAKSNLSDKNSTIYYKSDYFPRTEKIAYKNEKPQNKITGISNKNINNTTNRPEYIDKKALNQAIQEYKNSKNKVLPTLGTNNKINFEVPKQLQPIPIAALNQKDLTQLKKDENSNEEAQKEIKPKQTKPTTISNKKIPNKKNHSIHKKLKFLKKFVLSLATILFILITFVILVKIINQRKKTINEKFQDNPPKHQNNDLDIDNNYEVIDGFEIYGNKGIYLIKTDQSVNLIGTNGDNFSILKQFQHDNLRFKINQKNNNHLIATYGNWKGLILINDNFLELIKESNIN